MSIFLISPVFAEPVDVEIDWTIEGQPKTIVNPSTEESVEENHDTDVNAINEKIQKKSIETSTETEEFEDLITGSGYTIGTRLITIDTEEGKILNQMLIEQRQINKDNFLHLIKYLDRYSDGYVELAEALLDPVKEQKYLSSGISRNTYVDSNLENFLVERGYSLDDLESIPNNAFSPTKYDDVRLKASQMANDGQENVDLRELLPNYVAPDSQAMKEDMIRQLNKETSQVYESISSSQLDISVNQSPDLTNPISSNLFDDFQFVNTKFENTRHVIDSIEKPQTSFEFSENYNYNLMILIPIALGLIIFGYLSYRKSITKRQLSIVTVTPSVNYVENTLEMIQSSKDLFDDSMPKYAFEKFSQAIRYYYSNKLGINLDLTQSEMMYTLKKSDMPNCSQIQKWLQLCGKVEFVKHRSTQKEFIDSLETFRKLIS
ncbi:hypothetical protein OAJ90_02780 [Nitrosopumilus sp.]|nr:hypothetical protein [Nitrosopumilus sp.]